MIGIIVQLAISWLLIWLFEKKNLGVLGLLSTKRRMLDFGLFFLVTAACCASGFFMRMYYGERWGLNPSLTINLVATGLWWHIKSVLYEELIFHGVILYILIKRLGKHKAIIISAISFGIYHWFSHEVLGDATAMITTFLITGTMGLLYAYGYAKSFSLYIPAAIHLGWNFTQGFIFPRGPIGNGILIAIEPARVTTVSHFTYYLIAFLPIVSVWVINYLLLKRRRQEIPYG